MKLDQVTKLMILGVAVVTIATGCKKHPTDLTTLPGYKQPAPNTGATETQPLPLPPGPEIGNNGTGVGNGVNGTTLPQPTPGTTAPVDYSSYQNWPRNDEVLRNDTIHFAFDKSAIRSQDQSKVGEVANYMKNNPRVAVLVEGNCDERGTEEYNRALGERRALAAREALIGMGIPAERVPTISYGEDKPVAQGHNEEAWSQNRRDDFIVLTPPNQ